MAESPVAPKGPNVAAEASQKEMATRHLLTEGPSAMSTALKVIEDGKPVSDGKTISPDLKNAVEQATQSGLIKPPSRHEFIGLAVRLDQVTARQKSTSQKEELTNQISTIPSISRDPALITKTAKELANNPQFQALEKQRSLTSRDFANNPLVEGKIEASDEASKQYHNFLDAHLKSAGVPDSEKILVERALNGSNGYLEQGTDRKKFNELQENLKKDEKFLDEKEGKKPLLKDGLSSLDLRDNGKLVPDAAPGGIKPGSKGATLA